MIMKNFKICVEIELDENNPLEAAKTLEYWMKEKNTHFLYHVQNDETKEIFAVDLNDNTVELKENYKPIIKIK